METQKYDPNEMLKQMAAEAVKQQAHVRAAVRDLTLNALEAREFGINQVKSIVRKIAEGVSSGLGENPMPRNLFQMLSPGWTMHYSK
jgi:hypothetical protein